MPMFMDIHEGLGDATPEDVQAAHLKDLAIQDKYEVQYLTYWFNDPSGQVFCLVEAPTMEAAISCHKDGHGLMPSRMIEVERPRVDDFLGNWEKSVPARAHVDGPGTAPDMGLRTILFTDIEDSTGISTREGDQVFVEAVRTHNEIVRDALAAANGREVKHTGDGILASFVSTIKAVECTIAIQREFQQTDTHRVRIGLTVGEPVSEADDLFGAVVNLAARCCSHAEPSQIIVSSAVRDLMLGKSFSFVDRGNVELKGFDDPVQLYEVVY